MSSISPGGTGPSPASSGRRPLQLDCPHEVRVEPGALHARLLVPEPAQRVAQLLRLHHPHRFGRRRLRFLGGGILPFAGPLPPALGACSSWANWSVNVDPPVNSMPAFSERRHRQRDRPLP